MDIKKIAKHLLFPHMAAVIILLPISAAFLIYALLALDEVHPLRIASYVIAFYTLAIWSIRIPTIIRSIVRFKRENKYAKRWLGDAHLRMKVTLSANALWNAAYATLQLALGIYHRSAWFYSLAAYYFSLATMRTFLMHHTLKHAPGERMRSELIKYRACGWIFLIVNLALSGMMLYRIHEGRMVSHHEITTIAMAAYTFTSLTMAIINLIKYRKYNSPVFSASKAISLASACVSMLSLESTMLMTFGDGSMTEKTQILFLALSGGGVCALIVAMSIYMIVHSGRIMRSNTDERMKPNER